jgi:hypothetical protein
MGGIGHAHVAEGSFHRFVCPDAESRQGAEPEGMSQRDISGVAAMCNKNTADPRGVVARVKGVPPAAEIGFNPGRKNPWARRAAEGQYR